MRWNLDIARLIRRRVLVSALAALALLGAAGAFAAARAAANESKHAANIASTGPANQTPGQQVPGYRLGSGDHVQITVFGQKDLTGEYLVDGTGMLSFPLVGQVKAGGLTADELASELISKLQPNYLKDPKVSVQVLTYRPFYIVGEVRTPGSYAYVSGMTVINAVALAGGFTYRARDDSFYVTRSEKDGRKVKIDAAPDTPVQPGDVITVRERFF
ncbi:MAG TPA: polysaccharide biosynthesis/export family protein [Alphaproteobacteria bacterium]|nr:polysaccharide biosynthesis/export family protein [Alphaproteobacteria bacterium]